MLHVVECRDMTEKSLKATLKGNTLFITIIHTKTFNANLIKIEPYIRKL